MLRRELGDVAKELDSLVTGTVKPLDQELVKRGLAAIAPPSP